MNAPIRYFGSKGGFYSKIIENFPISDSYTTYIEPFGGTYTVGLHAPYTPPIEIYNDLFKNVYSLYKVLSDKTLYDEFKVKCDLAIYSQEFRNEYRERLKRDDLSLVDRAFYYFYVNRTSHNGIGGFSINTSIRRNMSKSVSDMLSCIDRLQETHERLSRVIVLNEDALKLIGKYSDRENVFMYLDPPYEQSTRTSARYDVDMNNQQHQEFIDLCCNVKCKMLISGYDCPLYDKLLENGFTKIQFEVKTVDGNMNKKTKIETLWKNY